MDTLEQSSKAYKNIQNKKNLHNFAAIKRPGGCVSILSQNSYVWTVSMHYGKRDQDTNSDNYTLFWLEKMSLAAKHDSWLMNEIISHDSTNYTCDNKNVLQNSYSGYHYKSQQLFWYRWKSLSHEPQTFLICNITNIITNIYRTYLFAVVTKDCYAQNIMRWLHQAMCYLCRNNGM